LQDITELAVAEDELQKSQYIVSSTPDGIALLDENYHYLIVNQTYERLFGTDQGSVHRPQHCRTSWSGGVRATRQTAFRSLSAR
jgi:PAS domain-containing protein